MESHVQMRKIALMICINILTIIIISSCGSEKAISPEQLLDRAKSMAEDDPQGALLTIDSLHELYPREIRSRRMADTIEWQIEYNEAIKNLPVLDSIISNDSLRLAELVKNFNYSKDEEYQDYGNYEHKYFRTENNTWRCYLKSTVNDRGDVVLISYYSGKKEEHNGFTVMSGEYERSIRDAENVSGFMDGGTYREFITVNDSLENGMIGFITSSDGGIVVRLNGEKEHEYTMGSNDIEAFRETMELAKLLQEINLYKMQIRKFRSKIELLGTRLGKQDD